MKNQLETLILMIQAQERWLLLCLIGRGLRCSAPTGHRGVSAQGHRGVTAAHIPAARRDDEHQGGWDRYARCPAGRTRSQGIEGRRVGREIDRRMRKQRRTGDARQRDRIQSCPERLQRRRMTIAPIDDANRVLLDVGEGERRAGRALCGGGRGIKRCEARDQGEQQRDPSGEAATSHRPCPVAGGN